MKRSRLLALCGLMLVSGCLTNAEQRAHQAVCSLATQPFDLLPSQSAETRPTTLPPVSAPAQQVHNPPGPELDVHTTSFMQAAEATQRDRAPVEAKTIPVPPEIPGFDVPRLPTREILPGDIKRVYPELPPLPEEPVARPGPDGKPYTLSALQNLAALNSPELHQAASDVEAARGNLIQAKAYPNPTVGYDFLPSSDNSVPSIQGPFINQTVKTVGKLKLAAAVAQKALDNAELALKRARFDLATRVRSTYYAVLVAKENVRVNKALARFTDQIYRQHVRLLGGGQAAPWEPTALRAQAYTARLAYKQASQAYIYSWQQLVATLGLRTLPLTEVEGRIDAFIPYFDFDAVRAHVLQNHTDVLIARNSIEAARYSLMAARVLPVPDVNFSLSVAKDYSVPPKQWSSSTTIGVTLPVWDQNRGSIMAAEAALMRASEEPHRLENYWTNTVAGAYTGYKQNLAALEDYVRHILPDNVQYYRGTYDAYHFNPASVPFGNIVSAQQALAASVTTYLTILGQVWTSVVSVADPLQTDDLFQLARPVPVPAIPDLDKLLAPWPCCHDCAQASACTGQESDVIKYSHGPKPELRAASPK